MKESVDIYRFNYVFSMRRKGAFSYSGLEKLYEYLIELEESTGEEQELDVVGICCEFSEYENLKEFQKAYGKEYQCIEDIENETEVIPVDDESFIIVDF